ncbi:MAG: histidine kinase [Caldimonas sp.]
MSLRTALTWATGVALLLSVQFLIQPFVWRNWPWDEVIEAWIWILLDRTVVASAMALFTLAALRLPVRGPVLMPIVIITAFALGAAAGEWALILFGTDGAAADAETLVTHVFRWTGMAVSVAGIVYLWQRASDTHDAARITELRRLQTERQIVQAQLQTLRSQIEPHFLFNTLATVRRLHTTEPTQGAELLRHFLDYLRATLPALHEQRSTLGQEIDLIRAYVGVIVVRMSERLRVTFDVPDALRACDFPPLTLATLIENAVKHGIAPAADGGTIHVQARGRNNALEVVVADTGVGFTGVGGSGIGLANIRSRLRTLYGADGVLSLENNLPSGVRAMMRLPLRKISP